jgi:hypothetical protein
MPVDWPKEQLTGGNYRPVRDIYVTNSKGELLRIVKSEHYMEADRLGHEYVGDWRSMWMSRMLKPGHMMCCDDGYIVRIIKVDYKMDLLVLETGTWRIPRVKNEIARKYHNPVKLKQFQITSNPCLFVDHERIAIVDKKILMYRRIAKRYLQNGFDFAEAWTKVTYRPSDLKTIGREIFKSDKWRLALSAEAKKYYEMAGVTPGLILKQLYDRMCAEDTPNQDAITIGKLLLRHHPDMEPNDIPELKQASKGPSGRIWIGDAAFAESVSEKNTVPAPPSQAPLPEPQDESEEEDNGQV